MFALFFPLLSLLLFVALLRYFLLYPQKPFHFLGIKIQGAIHAKREEIARGIAVKAATEFAGIQGLENQLIKPENFDKLKPAIEEHMDDFLRNRLKEQMPMIAMFIGDKTINSLKTIFINEIEKLFPRVIGQFAGNLQKDLPLSNLIQEKLNQIPADEITRQLKSTLRKPFALLYRMALVLGLFMAGVLWLLQYFVG